MSAIIYNYHDINSVDYICGYCKIKTKLEWCFNCQADEIITRRTITLNNKLKLETDQIRAIIEGKTNLVVIMRNNKKKMIIKFPGAKHMQKQFKEIL